MLGARKVVKASPVILYKKSQCSSDGIDGRFTRGGGGYVTRQAKRSKRKQEADLIVVMSPSSVQVWWFRDAALEQTVS